jgi:hypothetical protein
MSRAPTVPTEYPPAPKARTIPITLALLLVPAAMAGFFLRQSDGGRHKAAMHSVSRESATPALRQQASAVPLLPHAESSGAVGCSAVPSSCGYPDGSNTGAPAGVKLMDVPEDVSRGPGWHWDSRGWVEVDGERASFSGYRVNANVDVTGDGVTISNNMIVESGDGFGVSLRHTRRAVVKHNTITSPSATAGRLLVAVKNIYGDETGTRVLGNNISHVSTGVQIDSGVIKNNYIHDMGYRPGDHINGVTSDSGGPLLTIRHNTVLNQIAQTDAVSLFEDFGAQHDRVIDNNLLAGGGYTIYGGANAGGQATRNIKITNNRISRVYYPNGGFYGPATAFDPNRSGNIWFGNIWDDTGHVVVL